ncbi:MAG: magnesium transporter [Halobacteriota archaeon]
MSVSDDVWRIYRQSIVVLVVSLAGGLFAGTILGTAGMVEAFRNVPGLLLLLPAFLATRGNVYGALGARLGSGLHQGLIGDDLLHDRHLRTAVIASSINGLGISIVIGVLSWAIVSVLRPGTDPSLLTLVGVMFVAGVLTAVVMIVGLVALVIWGHDRGLDPDNLVGPIVTTLGDLFGVVFLYAAVIVVQAVI